MNKLVKLIIQIPCFNEEKNLPDTLSSLPKEIAGVDIIETLVVDDGSSDNTAEIAKKIGTNHIVSLGRNRGLGYAFQSGLRHSLALGADIVVNTDGDNQYDARDIPKLIAPILSGKADFVIGCRPIRSHPEFSPLKKALQWFGSWILRRTSKTDVPDAASGFRAYSRETCLRLMVYSRFSHCMETLIQAGNAGLTVTWTDIRVNPSTRPSRLFKSIPQYLWKSGCTIFAMSTLYAPGRIFSWLASLFLLPAFLLGARFFYLTYFTPLDPERTYLPSLILLAVLGITGFLLLALGLLGELLRTHRRLSEEIIYETKVLTLNRKHPKN